MKKLTFVLAAAGLMTLAACNQSPTAEAVEANGEMAADNLEAAADNLDAMADNATTATGEMALENQADNLNAVADNVEATADAVADNLN